MQRMLSRIIASVDRGKSNIIAAARAYLWQLRSFYQREGFYPLSYTIVPIMVFLINPPRIGTPSPLVDVPLKIIIAILAGLLHLPSYWLNSAQLRRLLAFQSSFVVLSSMLIPAAVFLHLLPITAAARFVTRRSVALALAILILVASANWVYHFPQPWWFMPGFAVFFGWIARFDVERERTNARLKLAAAESKRLGASAERERIARDLHDLLGQSLSLIAVKAELTKKLAPRDLERALQENDDVIRIAKNTLGEVRQAVTNYRAPTLEEELANANLALRSVGAVLYRDLEPTELSEDQEATLAFVLREAVTNVVRHAAASWCRVTLRASSGQVYFEVRDNGQGSGGAEGGGTCARAAQLGSGIKGMRERIEALGGTFEHSHEAGTCLRISLPLAAVRRGSQEVA